MRKPRPTGGLSAVLCVVCAVIARAAVAVPVPPDLPDLVPGEPYGTRLAYVDPFFPGEGPRAIRFSVATANEGIQPLELVAVPGQTDGTVEAYQCIGWVAAACVSTSHLGTYLVQPFFSEWFMDSFLKYELRRTLYTGGPDLTDEGLIAVGGRESVCPANTGRTKQQGRGITEGGSLASFDFCTWARAGISPGFYYAQPSDEAQQYVPLEGVPDGTYALVVRVNIASLMTESDNTNNVSFKVVTLSENGSKLWVSR